MTKTISWICLALALAAAIGYFLMGTGTLQAADLALDDAPPGFVWIASGFYVIAGVLLFMKKRGLTIALAVINMLPIVVFYVMWASRTDVMFSAPALITKIAQVLLEIALIYLVVKSKQAQTATAIK